MMLEAGVLQNFQTVRNMEKYISITFTQKLLLFLYKIKEA